MQTTNTTRRALLSAAIPAALAGHSIASATSADERWLDAQIAALTAETIALEASRIEGKYSLLLSLAAGLECSHQCSDHLDRAGYRRLEARLDALKDEAARRSGHAG